MTPVNDSGNQAMANLQAGWYNALVSGLNLDPTHFQTLQPSPWIGNSSAGLWEYFNLIPPATLTAQYSGAGGNQFYADYAAVIPQLISKSGASLQNALTDDYGSWLAYAKTLPAGSDLLAAFRQWAPVHCPDKVNAGSRAIVATQLDPVFRAEMALLQSPPATFSHTIDDLNAALTQATAGSVAYDSATASTNTSNTWASGEVGGSYDFFSASAGGSYTALSEKLASSHINVSATFSRVTTFQAVPGPWYSSGAFGIAYHQADNTVWAPGTSPTWDSTFGPQGNMQRFAGSLVVVDGISISVTSDASFSTSEQSAISAQADVGFWPFFAAKGNAGQDTSATFNDTGRMTTTTTSPPGNPAILGVNVLTAAEFLGGA
jgi:hypothetical protein